jgi:lipoyl(octanoyl) transferase
METEPGPSNAESTIDGVITASWLGRLEYPFAWSAQRELFCARLDRECGDTLMLLEHPPTYTLGRRASEQDIVSSDAEQLAKGISTFKVDRGGRATYHGPGQLVGYPIMALGERYDVLSYLRKLEEVLLRVAADLGVEAARDEKHTGVWVGQNKLGAIGVKITRGITMHGFAFNVAPDLSMFEGIVPCGLRDRGVTSIEGETGRRHNLKEVASLAANHLSNVFERPLVWAHASMVMRRAEATNSRSEHPSGTARDRRRDIVFKL